MRKNGPKKNALISTIIAAPFIIYFMILFISAYTGSNGGSFLSFLLFMIPFFIVFVVIVISIVMTVKKTKKNSNYDPLHTQTKADNPAPHSMSQRQYKQSMASYKDKQEKYHSASTVHEESCPSTLTVDNTVVCKSCGYINLSELDNCKLCGKPLHLTCPKCGKTNDALSVFCRYCGTSLKQEEK